MTKEPAHFRPLLRAAEIEAIPEEARVHALDSSSVRHTRSLGDATGLSSIGIHRVRLTPGRTSSVYHFHHHDEEWIYVLSGRGVAEIGDEKFEIGTGDFMGFVAGSLPHNLVNPNAEDLVYLVGGNRLLYDVCDYPRLRKRRYRVNGKNEYVDWDTLDKPVRK
ncbi:MAG: cupin domain-containing protein [Pseudomonadota bacterium]